MMGLKMLVFEVLMHSRNGDYLGNIHFRTLEDLSNYRKSLDVVYSPPNRVQPNPLTINEVLTEGYSEMRLLIN